jgi:putative MFS transporter
MSTTIDTPFEESPLRRFHFHVAFSACGGQFSDGFELGIIGIAIASATSLHLSALWMGLLGAAALAGLFFGALLVGPVVDRYGRHTIFAYDMLVMSVISGSQFFAPGPGTLLALRLLLGIVLGMDYVVSKSLVTELSPVRFRGRMLSILAIAWAAGYVFSYIAGYFMLGIGANAWRYMLIVSSLPALCIFGFRIGIPESPLWLIKRGRTEEALQVILRKLGTGIALPKSVSEVRKTGGEWAELFSPRWRKITAVGIIFYVCQVIPFFALSTFAPQIMQSLNVTDRYFGSLIYNVFVLMGAVIGMTVVDIIPRRSMLVVSFYLAAALLVLLALNVFGSTAAIIVFALFGLIINGAGNLEFVYPPELFPTHLRATGVGLAVAGSRIGAASSTFLLPIVVQDFGLGTALGACVGVLIFGGIICQAWAPETGKTRLSTIGENVVPPPVAP